MKAIDKIPEHFLLMSKRNDGEFRHYSCIANKKVAEIDIAYIHVKDGEKQGFLLFIGKT